MHVIHSTIMHCIQIFAAVLALCAIVALSKVNIDNVRAEAQVLSSHPDFLKYAIHTNTLICGLLFLLTCGGTLLYEIIILVKSLVSKNQNTKVLSIVVSYASSIVHKTTCRTTIANYVHGVYKLF